MTRALLLAALTALALPVTAQQTTTSLDRVVVAEVGDEGVEFVLSQSEVAELVASVLREPVGVRVVESRVEQGPAYELVTDVAIPGLPEGTSPRLTIPLETLEYGGRRLLVAVRPRA